VYTIGEMLVEIETKQGIPFTFMKFMTECISTVHTDRQSTVNTD
jgi:hypothetical protein